MSNLLKTADPMNGISHLPPVEEVAPLNLTVSTSPVSEDRKDSTEAVVKTTQSASSGSEFDGPLEGESADSDNASQHSPNNSNNNNIKTIASETVVSKKTTPTKRKANANDSGTANRDDNACNKRRKVQDDVTSECSESCDQSQSDTGKQTGKEPSDHLLAYNLFVRKLVDKTLNRSITFCEQPKSKITALEAACKRQFSDFAEDLHRTKIRCYLKACRRNAKKQYNRACNREGGSSVIGDFNEYTSSLASSPPSPSYSTPKNLPAHMATAKAKEIAAEALEKERDFIVKVNQMEENSTALGSNPTSDSSDTTNSNHNTSSGSGLASIPSSFTLFPFLPFLPHSAGGNDLSNLPALNPAIGTTTPSANGGGNSCTPSKANGFAEEKFGEFLQANFWRSVEMVKAMRLSAGFILMSAQKIEDALLVETSSPWQQEKSNSSETTTNSA